VLWYQICLNMSDLKCMVCVLEFGFHLYVSGWLSQDYSLGCLHLKASLWDERVWSLFQLSG
jgi:hypothetical protein